MKYPNMDQRSAQKTDREMLMKRLNELDFAIVEMTMYLDNHPNDRAALSRMQSIVQEQAKVYKEYTEKFGPIKSRDLQPGQGWLWAEENFPWDV
ncbi:MAG: spore coat protein CotJB [Bacillota bacterium]|jgi:spore coat protein JB